MDLAFRKSSNAEVLLRIRLSPPGFNEKGRMGEIEWFWWEG